jgi:hypothetical protein
VQALAGELAAARAGNAALAAQLRDFTALPHNAAATRALSPAALALIGDGSK